MGIYVDLGINISDEGEFTKFKDIAKYLGFKVFGISAFNLIDEPVKIGNLLFIPKVVEYVGKPSPRRKGIRRYIRSLYLSSKPGIAQLIRFGRTYNTLILSTEALMGLSEGDIKELSMRGIFIELPIKELSKVALGRRITRFRKVVNLLVKYFPQVIVTSNASRLRELWSPHTMVAFLVEIVGFDEYLALASISSHPYMLIKGVTGG
ncbi:MAG TPA: hypothetical protein ENF75_03330 [Acidilobales archaeon]|nr:hypothetical protein [Acidilobales archaeon]